MKRWLSYIVMAVLCGLYFSSCTKDEQMTAATDDGKVPVRLTLAFSGSSSRTIDSPTGDGGLDYTTEEQSTIVTGDVYVLVIDAVSQRLKYLVKDLAVSSTSTSQKVLEGTMLRTIAGEKVQLMVLANLNQNRITGVTTSSVQTYLENMVGKTITEVYNALVYNYTGPTPWEIKERRLPMWGISSATEVPPTGKDLECKLYRAVAKVSLWVNQKQGYQNANGDFTITGITVKNANDKGYCVSQAGLSDDEAIQYQLPYVTGLTMTPQTFNYTNLTVNSAYEDMIYLPEQMNTDENAVTLEVAYTYAGETKNGIIEFKKDGTGDRFNIVRNHVYVFNIQIKEDVETKLYYTVEDFTEHTVTIPSFE